MKLLTKSLNRKLRKALFHFEIENGYKKKLIMPLPKYIQLEPTIRCNYDCIGCTRLTVLKDRVMDISFNQVQKILSDWKISFPMGQQSDKNRPMTDLQMLMLFIVFYWLTFSTLYRKITF